jgi:predicted nuclease with RNAse H fold
MPVLEDVRTFPPGVASDRTLVSWIVDASPAVVAIDAPLSLPHSVLCTLRGCPRCRAGEAEYSGRDVDRMAGGMATVMLAAIAFRGIYLARTLREHGLGVIEVYPSAAYRRWAPDGAERESILGPRVTRFRASSLDECGAVAAALVAYEHVHARAASLDGADGTIWLPTGT